MSDKNNTANAMKEETFYRAFLTLIGFIFLFQCLVAQGTWLAISFMMAVFLFAFGMLGYAPKSSVYLSRMHEE